MIRRPDLVRRLAPPLLALAGLWAAAPLLAGRLLVNETPSVPRGLYLRLPDDRLAVDAFAAARQPPIATTYLAPLGVPSDMPLLKRVAGLAGDHACRDRNTVSVGARRAPVLAGDRRGAPLPAWRECRRLAADEVFLLGDTATSFDSRYFGPVRRRDILGVYRAALTW